MDGNVNVEDGSVEFAGGVVGVVGASVLSSNSHRTVCSDSVDACIDGAGSS